MCCVLGLWRLGMDALSLLIQPSMRPGITTGQKRLLQGFGIGLKAVLGKGKRANKFRTLILSVVRHKFMALRVTL